MNRRIIYTVLSACMLVGCSSKAVPKEVRQLQWLENADPISEANAALARKDKRLVGVNGYTWTMPGVDEQSKEDFRLKYGLRILDGTGDSIVSPEHRHLVGLADQYAKKYNAYILAHEK